MRELTLPARLILLPGLGTGPKIFTPQRQAFGDELITPAFIPHRDDENAGEYAARWAKQINAELSTEDDRPVFLGGLSFGGILAQEMATHLDIEPRAVLLIGSPRGGDRIKLLPQLAQRMADMLPAATLLKLRKPAVIGFGLIDGLDDLQKKLLLDAAEDLDTAFLKWAGKEAVDWPGFTSPPGYPPIHHIHGSKDWLVAPPSADLAERIEGGKHLINLTHAHSVNRFLFDRILEHCPEAQEDAPPIEDPHTTAQRRLTLEGAPAGTPLV